MNNKDRLEKETIKLLNEYKLEEMARIGYTEDGFEIFVYTNDGGNIPHFHYKSNNFHTCIRIDSAKYFEHGSKQGKLNTKQKKLLVKFLQDKDKYDNNKTNWQTLVIEWNRNNSNISIDLNTPMPNYLNLK